MILASVVLGGLCVGGIVLGRLLRPGYFDLLSPMCALYLFHGVARALVIMKAPSWAKLHPFVQTASDSDIAWAIWLTVGGVLAFSAGYAVAWARTRSEEEQSGITPLGGGRALTLLYVGLAPRAILLFSSMMGWPLAAWAYTPLETLGWAALAGLFLLSWRLGMTTIPSERRARLAVVALGFVGTLITAPNVGWSREALLQPVLVVCCGWLIGRQLSVLKTVGVVVGVVLPVLVLGQGIKEAASRYVPESRQGRMAAFQETEERYDSIGEMALASVVDRMHGLDSLIVCHYWVPDRRPFEPGSVWTQVLISAFVPRAIYPAKTVGWAERFAVEFWGTTSAGIGISHLGNLYIYGGVLGCVTGMFVLGAGLGFLVAQLSNRGDALALCAVFLVGLTVLQIDRDLETVLGGVLKVLALGYVVARLSSKEPDESKDGVPEATA